MIAIDIFFRWLHILTACVAVGGVFFMVLAVPVGLRSLDSVVRDEVGLRFRRIFKIILHGCILLFLISGIYNAIANWPAYKHGVPLTHALFGLHALLALLIFVLWLWLLAGKRPTGWTRRWLAFSFILLLITVAVASSLKWAREQGLAASSTTQTGPHRLSAMAPSQRNFGFWIADFGTKSIQNPKSKIQNRPRHAIMRLPAIQ